MQSDGNSFWGDVVLDNFNMAYRAKESILDKNMNIKTFGMFIMMILNLRLVEEMHIKRKTAHNNMELIKLGVSATVVLVYNFK